MQVIRWINKGLLRGLSWVTNNIYNHILMGPHVCLVAKLCLTLQPHGFICPWDSPGKNTGVGCHFLLQGILPVQVLNPCLLCLLLWQADSLPLSHLGSLIPSTGTLILRYMSVCVFISLPKVFCLILQISMNHHAVWKKATLSISQKFRVAIKIKTSRINFSSVQFSRSVMSDSLRPHGL